MTHVRWIAVAAAVVVLLAGCGNDPGVEPVNRWIAEPHADTDCQWVEEAPLAPVDDLADRAEAYARVEVAPDLTGLTADQRRVLDQLVAAGRIMHELFRVQATPCYDAMHARVAAYDGEQADALRRYFAINAGPWDRRQGFEPFLGGWERPEGANYYPRELTRADRDQIQADEQLSNLLTMVRRDDAGELVAIAYREFFRPGLEQAAAHLRQAAQITENASLAAFLEARADAFLSDDYYESDLLWMDLDSRVEATIGPYEVYEDKLFGYKAAFEAFVTVTDPVESERLATFKTELPWLEANLPLPDEHKNLDRGSESPIRVVDLVYSGGDTRAGVQTIAFNLPNDERVREAKGSKKVMLRNMMDAKFQQILQPIAETVIAPEQLPHLTSESFFLHTLWHEMSHGLGPGKITVDGRETEVRRELKDTYATIEEVKADVMGEWDILKLHAAGRDHFPEGITEQQPVTYLAGMFRSVRFGAESAHGQANAIQFNYLLENGAIGHDPATGQFAVDFDRFLPTLELLLNEILVMQAEGDYAAAQRLIAEYGELPESMTAALARLDHIPVDIQPQFVHYPED
jgi:hypothetical protein